MVQPARLEVAFHWGCQILFLAQDDTEDQTLSCAVIRKAVGQPRFNGVSNLIDPVPECVATLDYGDQSRIANRSGPENSLPLEVASKVKDAGISIVDRTPQTHNYFDAITGSQFERVEERNEFRIFKELGQTCAPAIRNAVYRVDVNVEVDAEASPVRTLQQAANDPAGFVSGRKRWNGLLTRTEAGAEKKHGDQRTGSPCTTQNNGERKAHPYCARIEAV